ncbi:MAG: V-type ATP synthase subunit I [Nanoarchaeota archaeon]
MLKPKPMQKATVYCSRTRLQDVISTLYSLGAVHLIDHVKDSQADIGEPMPQAAAISEVLTKVNAVATFLGIDLRAVEPKNNNKFTFAEYKEKVEILFEKVSALQQKAMSLQEQRQRSAKEERLKLILDSLELRPDMLHGFDTLTCQLFTAKEAPSPEELKQVTKHVTMVHAPFEQGEAFALFYTSAAKEDMQAYLAKCTATEVQLPKDFQPEELKARQERLQAELTDISSQKKEIKEKVIRFLKRSELVMQEHLEKAQAPLHFAATENTVRITGYVPHDRTEAVRTALVDATAGNIMVLFSLPEKNDSVPVRLSNKGGAKPFEFLMRLYTLPGYKDLDPTSLMFLTFPFFFGFMLGDIGYGIVGLILFMILRKAIKTGKDLWGILMAASVGTILFGFLFGEVFGSEEIFGRELWHILSRAHEINQLLLLSLIVGAIHVNFGLLLGFFQELHHGFVHAFCAKISWMVLQAGALMIYFKVNPWGYGLVGLAIVLLLIGEGVRGIVELPSIFGNILSYSRLMALGLASVMLAIIINEKAGGMIASGGFGIAAGILVLVLGHAINLALGLLGPFLHSLRLHYVEFFSKFFHGGGQPYRPFGVQR